MGVGKRLKNVAKAARQSGKSLNWRAAWQSGKSLNWQSGKSLNWLTAWALVTPSPGEGGKQSGKSLN